MGIEIERKFLISEGEAKNKFFNFLNEIKNEYNKVDNLGCQINRNGEAKPLLINKIKQGYISNDIDGTVVRVRTKLCENGLTSSYLTIKTKNIGITRREFEYEIPYQDGIEMLNTIVSQKSSVIEKTRYVYEFTIPLNKNDFRDKEQYKTYIWEIDVFHGNNDGLIIAEIELNDENEEIIEFPDFIILDNEVSDDSRYYNSNLIKNPFCKW